MKLSSSSCMKLTSAFIIVAVVGLIIIHNFVHVPNGYKNVISLFIGALPIVSFFAYIVSLIRSKSHIEGPEAKRIMEGTRILWVLSLLALPMFILACIFTSAFSGMCGVNGGSCGYVTVFPVLIITAVITFCLSVASLVSTDSAYKSGYYKGVIVYATLPFFGIVAMLFAILVAMIVS